MANVKRSHNNEHKAKQKLKQPMFFSNRRPHTPTRRQAPHALVVTVRHQDVAGRVHRNTGGTGEGGRGARAIDPSAIGARAAARQGGHHCTTQLARTDNSSDDGEQRGGVLG